MSRTERFRAIVQRADFGLRQHVVYLPDDIAARYASRLRLRVVGKIEGVPFRLALLSRKDGSRYLSIGSSLRSAAKLREGDEARLEFTEDPHAERIDIPIEMQIALRQEPAIRKKFQALTPGAQRSVVFYVASARTEDTRIRRSHDVLRKLDRGELAVQQRKQKSTDAD